MERGAWTEERLDDLATSMREGFARVDQDIRDLRAEMNDGFKQMRGELGAVRTELTAQIDALRQTMIRFGAGMLVAFVIGYVSLLATIIARGG